MKEEGEKTLGELLIEAAEEMLAVHRGELEPVRIHRWVKDESGEWRKIGDDPDSVKDWEARRAAS